jgi:thiol-disulfide isomerase/thioredoxin
MRSSGKCRMFRRICAIVLFAFGITPPSAHAENFSQHFVPANASQPAPQLSFEDAKGQTLNLKDFQGRYILLNLWATWCSPCRHEIPSLDALQTQLGDAHFTVITLTEDSNGVAAAKEFFDRNNIHHLAIYTDNSGTAPSLFHAHGLPTTYLIDPHGNEIGRVEGEVDWGAPDSISFLKQKIAP